jgi:ATP-binding cassette, subfamily B, heavy metal transporter
MLFNILPIIIEVTLTCIILLVNYSVWISLITFSVIVIYVFCTIAITEWRTKFRREMNKYDNESNDRAIDGLLNFETVKYFNAERHEKNRYDESLKKLVIATEKSQVSLALLNISQAAIISFGQFVVMLLTALSVTQGNITVGDFVLV